ncbi:hypothetical protein Q9S36_25065 [Microbacterium sp. ARD31]|uniref:hypothetical protein n=1 Tax=Microbacterium sp. ARD31 TaxID=2962576 RepID=UPI002881DFC1|nr:hypothetical protein [Microbacterium sp. ARD31]MDT0183463.1 hypothetical protein [Microbacterium sp. ARD31]
MTVVGDPMSNDVHMMAIAIVATQAGIAVLLMLMANLEPGSRGRDTHSSPPRQVPVRREALPRDRARHARR